MKEKFMNLLRLFAVFFKIGAFTFGGGYAMISLIEDEVVSKRKWLDKDEMFNIISIAESTPGPISLNTATFVGTRVGGVLGALFSTLGLVLPSLVIIIAVYFFLDYFQNYAIIAYALNGIKACVVVLILNAFLKFFKNMEKNVFSYIVLIAAFFIALLVNVSVIWLIVAGAALGVVYTIVVNVVAKKRAGKAASAEDASPEISESADGAQPNDADSAEGEDK